MGGASPRPRPHPDFRLPASGLQNQQSMNRDTTAFGHRPAPACSGCPRTRVPRATALSRRWGYGCEAHRARRGQSRGGRGDDAAACVRLDG